MDIDYALSQHYLCLQYVFRDKAGLKECLDLTSPEGTTDDTDRRVIRTVDLRERPEKRRRPGKTEADRRTWP